MYKQQGVGVYAAGDTQLHSICMRVLHCLTNNEGFMLQETLPVQLIYLHMLYYAYKQ